MAWVRIVRDTDWPKGRSWHTAYKAGMRCSVTAEVARDLVAVDAAEAIRTPARADAEALKADPFWQAASTK